ncbi:hypothetical protein AAFF_G00222420 [Aldrovandia affinis]|uniref:Uncharacterized protein n=1 Tax=Aldrovandia affinis TaxID=143900 RepID=A0AAD7W3X1_9TELE|nr:hypothetical protein AAFF_G00222420 [Aldrovandia affinis]
MPTISIPLIRANQRARFLLPFTQPQRPDKAGSAEAVVLSVSEGQRNAVRGKTMAKPGLGEMESVSTGPDSSTDGGDKDPEEKTRPERLANALPEPRPPHTRLKYNPSG